MDQEVLQISNAKATNQIKNTLKNTLTEMKSMNCSKISFKGVFEGAEQIVSAASKGMIKDMVNTTFDSLSPELNSGLHKLYKMSMVKCLQKLEYSTCEKSATAAHKRQ